MLHEKRIAELSDNELHNYYNNAVRLAQSGTDAQREEALSLLPILSAAIEARSKEEVKSAKKSSASRGRAGNLRSAKKARAERWEDDPTEH